MSTGMLRWLQLWGPFLSLVFQSQCNFEWSLTEWSISKDYLYNFWWNCHKYPHQYDFSSASCELNKSSILGTIPCRKRCRVMLHSLMKGRNDRSPWLAFKTNSRQKSLDQVTIIFHKNQSSLLFFVKPECLTQANINNILILYWAAFKKWLV